ncbi:MAG: hypothetical protein QOI41_377 [Myxococcales bacterium]|jgi:uncharacterized Zn finger protein|nr:hypothetical protein [Myxococcales bacterium]
MATTVHRPALRWRVAHRFTSYSRQRGSEMARARAHDERVEIEEGSDRHALARVRDGPSLFVVRLDAVSRELQVACTCPVFALGRDACRHVWAALVAVDRVAHRAHLARLRGRRRARAFELVRARLERGWPRLRR